MIDFNLYANTRRLLGYKTDLLARAIGSKPGLRIIDAMTGLAQDAFFLASLGCKLELYERNPVLGLALAKALISPDLKASTKAVLGNLQLKLGDAKDLLLSTDFAPEVIYFDPMFQSQKSAKAKKNMQALKDLLSSNEVNDYQQIFANALSLKPKKIVIKRHIKAPSLIAQPNYSLQGKTIRFDIYVF